MRFAATFPFVLLGLGLAAGSWGNVVPEEKLSRGMTAGLDDFSVEWLEKADQLAANFRLGKTSVTMVCSAGQDTSDGGVVFRNLPAENTVLNGTLISSQQALPPQDLPQPAWLFAEGRGTYFYSENPVHLSRLPLPDSTGSVGIDLQVQWSEPAEAATPRVSITTAQPDAAAMGNWIAQMQNRLTAPLQIMQADQRAEIVYDRTAQTTGYVLLVASERLNSEGYLNGSNQVCAVVLKPGGGQMQVSAGLPATAQNPTLRLKLFGYWQPAPEEKKIIVCQRKAGRTWIEFKVAPGASSTVSLAKLPDPGIVEWVRRLFQ